MRYLYLLLFSILFIQVKAQTETFVCLEKKVYPIGCTSCDNVRTGKVITGIEATINSKKTELLDPIIIKYTTTTATLIDYKQATVTFTLANTAYSTIPELLTALSSCQATGSKAVIDTLLYANDTLAISFKYDSVAAYKVKIGDQQYIDTASFSSDTLRLSIYNDKKSQTKIYIPSGGGGSDDQKLDTAFILNDTIYLSLESDGETAKKLSLEPYLDNTDGQILVWSPSTGLLTISGGNAVNLDGRYISSITHDIVTNGNVISQTINGTTDTTLAIRSVSNTSTVNNLSTTVNGVTGSNVPIVNSISNTSSSNNLSTTVNGVTGSNVSIINSNVIGFQNPILTSTINGITDTALISVTSSITNDIVTNGNVITSTVNGVADTTLAVRSVSNTSSANSLSTTVNGVTGSNVNIINSNSNSLSGNVITGSVNGISDTVLVIGQVNGNLSGNTQTINVNGVTDTMLVVGQVNANLLGNVITANVNGVTDTVLVIGANSLGLSSNNLTSTVNGVVSNSVSLSSYLDNTDNQALSIRAGKGTIDLTNSVSITLADSSATNELQTISVASGTTTLSNSGGSMTIAGAGINSVGTSGSTITITGTEVDGSVSNELQTVDSFLITTNQLRLSLSQDAPTYTVNLNPYLDNTDNQNINFGTKSGSDVPLNIDNGAGVKFTEGSGITLTRNASNQVTISSSVVYTDENAQDAVGLMIDGSLNYVDATPLLQRAALTGDVTASAGSNTTTIATGAVTTAKLADSSVTAVKIISNAVTTTGLATGSVTTQKILDNTITDADIRQSAALSVIGNSTNSTANVADITAGTDNYVLRRSGTSLGFGQVATGGVADSAITEIKLISNSVGTTALKSGSVTTVKLADSSVTAIKIISNSIDATQLKSTTVTAGTYTNTNLTVDSDGRITSASNGTSGVTDGDKGDIDVTSSGSIWSLDTNAVMTIDIIDDAVTNAKLANVPTSTFKGRTTAGTGDPEDLTISQAKTLLNLTGTNSGDQTINLTGDVTGSGTGSFATTISNDAVTYAKLQNVAANSFLANTAGSIGDVQELNAGASQLAGRGSTGNISMITLGTNLSMSGTTLNATSGATTNDIVTNGNVITSTVNGISDTTVAIRTVSNTSSANNLSTTVNGVTGSNVNIINSISNTSSANNLSTTANGVTGSNVSIINSNVANLSGNTITSTINGVADTVLVIGQVNGNLSGNVATINVNGVTDTMLVVTHSLSSSGNVITSTTNGVAPTANIVNSISNTSSTNNLSTTVNGITGSNVSIINSNVLNLSGNQLTETINGVSDTSLVIGTNLVSLSGNSITSNVNGITDTVLVIGNVTQTLSSNNLSTTVNGVQSNTVSLSSYLDNTDNQALSIRSGKGTIDLTNSTSITLADSSATNELQTYAHSGTTSYTNTLSNSGGSFTLQSSGIATISNSSGTVTIGATEVDGSTTNELQTVDSFNITTNQLRLSLSQDAPTYTVNLNPYLDNTDNQNLSYNSGTRSVDITSGTSATLPLSVADGATLGLSSFNANDFNSSSGIISLDYTNAQKATTGQHGFLTSTDWNTFNGKVGPSRSISTAAPLSGGGDLSTDRTITTSMNTNKLIGRSTAGTGVMEEISIGSGLSLSSGTISVTGGGGDILQNGNSFSAAYRIGSNDNNTVSLEVQDTVAQTIGTDGNISLINKVANNVSAIENRLTIQTNSHGTPAIGFGSGILFKAESSTTDDQDQAQLYSRWQTATHASRAGEFGIKLGYSGGSLSDVFRINRSLTDGQIIFGAANPMYIQTDGITASGNYYIASGGSSPGTSYPLQILATNINTGIALILNGGQTDASYNVFGNQSFSNTSGMKVDFKYQSNFAPTSGTGTFYNFCVDNTINQTGGANGVSGGFLINPTLTSASNYRAIDIVPSNSSAYGIYQQGVLTRNYFAGVNIFDNYFETKEISAPTTPSTGYGRVYEKTDNKLYFKNDAGTEYDLTATGSISTNVLSLSGNTMTSTVEGIADTSLVIGQVNVNLSSNSITLNVNGITDTVLVIGQHTLTSATNSMTNIENGLSASANIINSNALSSSTNTITSTINGVANSGTGTIINTNVLNLSGNTLTETINGVADTSLVIGINTVNLAGNEITSNVNGKTDTTLVIGVNTVNLAGNQITSNVNGKTDTTLVIGVNTLTYSSSANTLISTVNGVASATTSLKYGIDSTFYYPENYGAVANDVTDDRAAIQAAIDSACNRGGGIVWINKGEFRVTTTASRGTYNSGLHLCSNVILMGTGFQSVIKSTITTSGQHIISLPHAGSNVKIMDLQIKSDSLPSGAAVFESAGITNFTMDRVKIDRGTSWGVLLKESSKGLITNCDIQNNGPAHCIELNDCNNYIVRNNWLYSNTSRTYHPSRGNGIETFYNDQGELHPYSNLLEGNMIYNTGGGITIWGDSMTTVSNNTIRNICGGGIYVLTEKDGSATTVNAGIKILGNTISQVGYISNSKLGMLIEAGNHDILIENNYIDTVYTNDAGSGGGVGIDQQADGTIMNGNRINHCYVNGISNSGKKCVISGNTILDCSVLTINGYRGISNSGANCVISSNSVHDTRSTARMDLCIYNPGDRSVIVTNNCSGAINGGIYDSSGTSIKNDNIE